MVVGHRLTISPLSILDLAVLLGVGVGDDRGAAGGAAADHHEDRSSPPPARPDIAGFLFEHGTLTHVGDPDEEEDEERQEMEPAMVDTPKARHLGRPPRQKRGCSSVG